MDSTLSIVSQLAQLGVYEWDAKDDCYINVSEEYAILFGVTRADLLSRYRDLNTDLQTWVHPDDYDRYVENDKYYADNPAEYKIEYRIIDSNGHERTILETARPVWDQSGDVTRWVGVCQDVTDLTDALRRAEAANVAKSAFLAAMSHEIRTPVAGIMGLADMLTAGGLDGEQARHAAKIRAVGEALTRLLNDILDLSKLEAGKFDLERITFDPHALIQEVVDLFYVTAADKGIVLNVSLGTPMPNAIVGDPTRIRQILVNLVGNAVKFTPEGQVSVNVSHTPAADGDTVSLRFEIHDTGIGIATNRQTDIFEDFTQADSSTARKFEGTGLGLAISRRLTELMGGTIGVESTEGAGAVFWFEVPCHLDVRDDPEPDATAPPASAVPARALNVLVAEDNELLQMVTVAILQRAGHTATVVANGRLAVEHVRDGAFDVVLMDVRMPELDGMGATRQIRKLDGPKADVPVIAVTADAIIENRDAYFAAGMNACVLKPIAPDELLGSMETVMAGRNGRA